MIKKSKYFAGVIGGFILLCSVPLFAAPTLGGPTGLIEVPTAESLRYREFNMAVDMVTKTDTVEDPTYVYKFNLGTFKNWELGVVGGTVPTEGVFVNAKYYLLSDEERYPLSIAIGVQNLASETLTDVYMVASKRFQGGILAHFGFSANFAEEVTPAIMGGAEYLINDSLSLIADAKGNKTDYVVNAGAAFYLFEEVVLKASILDVTNQSENRTITAGVSFAKFL